MKTSIRRWENRARAFQVRELSIFCDSCLGKGIFLLFLVCALTAWPIGMVQAQQKPDLSIAAVRSAYVNQLATESRAVKAEAEAWARARDIPIRYDDGWNVYELMYLEDGWPIYNKTYNINAAISTATDLVRDFTPYYLEGSGLILGLWDEGVVRSTHQEFGPRVSKVDSTSPTSNHATHVAGTIAASGIYPLARGMAPNVNIDSYDWKQDLSEMAARGAHHAGQPNKIYVSNHSYGIMTGWEETDFSGSQGWHWFPPWNGADSVADWFGRYGDEVRSCDDIAYRLPYYLIFKSAGNDRNDNPQSGDTVYYTTDGGVTWNSIVYSTATCPPGDGLVKGGYDTIPLRGVAKNVMTVGSVADVVACGIRLLPKATMSTFSSWGPTDDGRIKVDIVANGEGLISPWAWSNSAYATRGGTSQSTPNASGSAILLQEYYAEVFPGRAMRSSTLKGLIIHTADDLGNPGPDYSFGWGLMNTARAVTLIKQHHDDPSANMIVEGFLNARNPGDSYKIINVSRSETIRATLCWTDPPATATTRHDDRSPRLVNDLDLRMVSSGGSTYYPYVLDPSNPSDAATTGDNTLDNVEQIYIIPSWPYFESEYTVQVSHKGALRNDEQNYSLILNLGDINTMWVLSECTTLIEGGYGESFEEGFGYWVDVDTCDTHWSRQRGGTPSSGTGPSSARDGDYYLYIKSSGDGFPNKIAILESPCLSPLPTRHILEGVDVYLEFWYHMYGTEMGTLSVEISDGGRPWTRHWSRSGNQGNNWHKSEVRAYYPDGGPIRIRFMGITGTGNTSDIAIDDVYCRVNYGT